MFKSELKRRAFNWSWRPGIAVSIFGLCLCLIGLAAIAWAILEHKETTQAFAWGVFVAVALYILTDKVQAILSAFTDAGLHHRIEYVVENIGDFKYIGDHAEGLRYCAERMKRADFFRDTYLRTSIDTINLTRPRLAREFYAAVGKMIQDNDGSFKCLVSTNNSEVFQKLTKDLRDRLSKHNKLGRFDIQPIEHGDIPLIGIQILEHRRSDIPDEVVVGWNFQKDDSGRVFSSTHPQIVRYFRAFYDQLEVAAKNQSKAKAISSGH